MWFFKRFDLFDIKKSNEKTKVFILYKKKVDKMRSVNRKFFNESKSFENDDWKTSIIAEKKIENFICFEWNTITDWYQSFRRFIKIRE